MNAYSISLPTDPSQSSCYGAGRNTWYRITFHYVIKGTFAPGGAGIRGGYIIVREIETPRFYIECANNNIAPSTRNTDRPSTPEPRPIVGQYDMPVKYHFFKVYDIYQHEYTLRKIYNITDTTSPTARRWIDQREREGAVAIYKRRKRSKILGRNSRVSIEMCRMFVSPLCNKVRDQCWEAQIEYH